MSAVVYLRVSSAGQVDGFGLEAQEDAVRTMAGRLELELGPVLRDVVSGTVAPGERPGLAEALRLVADGEADGLAVARLDRLARHLTHQEAALAQVWRHGGQVWSADVGLVPTDDPDDPMRTAMRQMMGVFAQLDRSMLTARMRRGRQLKAQAGGYVGGTVPYGACPGEAEVLARIHALRADGLALRAIGERLALEGLAPRGGGRWHPKVLADALRRTT